MAVVISLLRGVNVGGHHKISMDSLRALYESLGLRDVSTYVNSGNVVFRTAKRDLAALASQIADAIESSAGFRAEVVLRTPADLRDVIARSPFATRSDVEPGKLAVFFLAAEPSQEARAKIAAFPAVPEEVHISGRELFIYFPNGQARPKLSLPALERALKVTSTARNWNTVTRLLEMAAEME